MSELATEHDLRDAFDAALAEGANLVCMGANTAYCRCAVS
jgi:hypothetical protein